MSIHSSAAHNPGDLKELSVHGILYRFRYCPPGTFMMGSPNDEVERDSNNDDEQLHRVTLTQGFWMQETPVTQGMWKSVMGTGIEEQKKKTTYLAGEGRAAYKLWGEGENYPVYYVSWNECQEFCEKLSQLLGQKITLPTEAQWEYACRAGTTGMYSGSGNLDEMGWYDENSGQSTHEVKQKKPNAWNLYDMHGNVWEWCQDWIQDYSDQDATDPTGPIRGATHVCRGGGWGNHAMNCRSAVRFNYDSRLRYFVLGFRLLLHSQE